MLTFETIPTFFSSNDEKIRIVGYDELDMFLIVHNSKGRGYIELVNMKSKARKRLHSYDSIHSKCTGASVHLKANLLGNNFHNCKAHKSHSIYDREKSIIAYTITL